jgi:ubiquinone/menaquinone biosynthesis C-methylase UbiE
MIPKLGWRVYSLVSLALRPHVFFAELAALDWYLDTLRAWTSWLSPKPASTVLEVGCSTGALAYELANLDHTVVGLDRSAVAIRYARSAGNRANPTFMIGNACDLPLQGECFDCTLAASLLNIVADPAQVIAEMARVTVPNGIVSCLFPTPYMDAGSARQFIRKHALTGFPAEAISLWAARAPKLEPSDAIQLLISAQLIETSRAYLLDGMVCAISGRRRQGQSPG